MIFFLFVETTAKALNPSGMQFVQHMVNKRRFSIFMVISSTLTVLSGALLLWQVAYGRWGNYVQTGPGLVFVLGSLAGVMVYFIGMFGVNPRAKQMARIGADIQAAGGSPTPEQGAALQKLDKEMSTLGLLDFISLPCPLLLWEPLVIGYSKLSSTRCEVVVGEALYPVPSHPMD